MKRRELVISASVVATSGCTLGTDPISVRIINRSENDHSVTVRVNQSGGLVLNETMRVEAGETSELGELSWQDGEYKVTVQVDDTPSLANDFSSDNRFNGLNIIVNSKNSVKIQTRSYR